MCSWVSWVWYCSRKRKKRKKSPLLRTWSSRFLLLSLEHIRIEPGMLCLLSGILLFWFLPSQLIQLHFFSPVFSHEVKCYSRLNDLYFTLMWSSQLTRYCNAKNHQSQDTDIFKGQALVSDIYLALNRSNIELANFGSSLFLLVGKSSVSPLWDDHHDN